MKLAKLTNRVAMVQPQVARQPWQKSPLSAQRPLSGQQRKKRNDRIKLRDKYHCQECGRLTHELEIDHRIPLSQGGTESDSNLQSMCVDCHKIKTQRESNGRGYVSV